jgi:ribonuclease BN (tRNA processing enzyme)
MARMILTPIGTSPAWYNPGVAGSGYLLQVDDLRILIDCGSGVIMQYLARASVDGNAAPLDAIVISHTHADHVLDLVPLTYGIMLGGLSWSPQLFLPHGARERLQRMVGMWDGPANFFEQAFDVCEYRPGAPWNIGGVTVSAAVMPHFLASCALRFDTEDAAFGYTADLGPNLEIASFIQSVDVLLCEATLAEEHGEQSAARGHLSGSEAGDIARAADAAHLLLTHIPAQLDAGAVVAAAREAFGGPVALAQPWEAVAVGASA